MKMMDVANEMAVALGCSHCEDVRFPEHSWAVTTDAQ